MNNAVEEVDPNPWVPERPDNEFVVDTTNPISQPVSYQFQTSQFFIALAGVFAFIGLVVGILLIVRRCKRGTGAKEERKFAKMEEDMETRTVKGAVGPAVPEKAQKTKDMTGYIKKVKVAVV